MIRSMRSAAVVAVLMLSLTGCAFGPTGTATPAGGSQKASATSTSSSSASATASGIVEKLQIVCKDPSGELQIFDTLKQAWAAGKNTVLTDCYSNERIPSSQSLKLSMEELILTRELVKAGFGMDEYSPLAYMSLLAICGAWGPSQEAKYASESSRKAVGIALKVCPENPKAGAMKAFAAAPAAPVPTTKTVTYVVESDAPIGVITYTTFINGQMGQEQASDQAAGTIKKDYTYPLRYFDGSGLVSLGVGAQAGAGATSITCRVLIDGQERIAKTSTGPYTVVSCNT